MYNTTGIVTLMSLAVTFRLLRDKSMTYDKCALERSEAERKLMTAHEIGEAAERDKTEFTAFLVHELRNPLQIILSMLEKLAEDQPLLETERKDCVAAANLAADVMLRLINDVLDINKLRSGKHVFGFVVESYSEFMYAGLMEVTPEPVNVRRFAENVFAMYEKSFQKKNLRFVANFTDHLPIEAMIDQKRVMQILCNLLSNALKFTATGTVTFRAHQSVTTRTLVFSIKDTGVVRLRVEI
jgi:osomolarity two-component system, sensor histidine kinase NIK1